MAPEGVSPHREEYVLSVSTKLVRQATKYEQGMTNARQ
jgi:hypothetical protein